MNKERRATLTGIVKEVSDIQSHIGVALAALGNIETITLAGQIEEVKDEEQDSFDNMTEGLQATERGQQMQAAIEAMDEAINALSEIGELVESLSEADGKVDEVLGYLDTAME